MPIVGQLVVGLGAGDEPRGWERVAAVREQIAPPAAPKVEEEWRFTAERFQLDLLLAECPEGMLPDLPGPDELRAEAAQRARVLGGDSAGFAGFELAEMLFSSGRRTSAESVTAWLLDELEEAPGFVFAAPRIHYLRAEIAREAGSWSTLDSELAAGEVALAAEEAALAAAKPPARDYYRPLYCEDKARLLALRAQVLIVDLGLLDQGGDLLHEAELAAEESGNQSPKLAVALVGVDKLLMQERFQDVIDLVQPLRDEGGRFVPIYVSAEGLATLELEREGKPTEPSAAVLLREVIASESAPGAAGPTPRVHLADALLIERARNLREAAVSDPELDAELRRALHDASRVARQNRGADGRPLEDEGVLAVLEWRYATERGDAAARERLLGVYDRLLAACPPGPSCPLELRLVQLLMRRVRVIEAREHVVAAYDDLLEVWDKSAQRPGGLGFLQYQARRTRVISAAVDTDLASSPGEPGKRAALERLFQVQAMGSLARELRLGPCTLDEVRAELLGPKEGCLVFLPAADASHLFVFDRSTLEHYRLAPLDDLQPLVKSARADKGEAKEKSARALRDAILPPAARPWIESHEELTLAGFGLLPGLQVEELPAWPAQPPGTKPTEAAPLGARFAIASLPSVPLALSLARRARGQPAPVDALVLAVNADPHGVADLEPFDFGDPERSALSAPFPAAKTRYLVDASRADLEALAKDRHGVVHVLCHGVWDRGQEAGAALVLAQDGDQDEADLVHPDDLPALAANLLILTACGAQRGPQRLGDDLATTLGGQALANGASCALVADGQVEVTAALQMGKVLTRELAAGASPAEALRRATAELPDQAKRARYRVLGLGHKR